MNNVIDDLKQVANALASKIDDIRNTSIPEELHAYSDLIMGMLRAERIFIKEETVAKYINGEYGYTTATLHPEDLSINPNGKWYPIFANSFGPWKSKRYFELKGDWDEPRILWLLKEPLLEGTWHEGDRGGRNQAIENLTWENIDPNNKTLRRVVQLSKIYLERICEKIFTENETLVHLCIIEVNHYPGLALRSHDTNQNILLKWAEINLKLINSLIHFYKPTIVIGAHTLDVIHRCKPSKCNSNYDTIINNITNDGTLLNSLGYVADSKFATEEFINSNINYIIPTIDDGPIFVQANHPSRSSNFKEENAVRDSSLIKKYLTLL